MSGTVHFASPGVLFQFAVGFRRNSESRVRLCCVSQERLEKHLAKALPALVGGVIAKFG